jgi:hypothetical protein
MPLPLWVPDWTVQPQVVPESTLTLTIKPTPMVVNNLRCSQTTVNINRRGLMPAYVDDFGDLIAEGILLDIVSSAEGPNVLFNYAGRMKSSESWFFSSGFTLWLFPKTTMPVIISTRHFYVLSVRSAGGKPPRRQNFVARGVEGSFVGKCQIKVVKNHGGDKEENVEGKMGSKKPHRYTRTDRSDLENSQEVFWCFLDSSKL